uniref:Uncharacterized protein n=1 Tax=Anguilla anguilla TaxID=7936 RepID=A0A0E9TV89_ANGAN
MPIQEYVEIHSSPLKLGATRCFFSHCRLQLSLHRVELDEDLSHAALTEIYGC